MYVRAFCPYLFCFSESRKRNSLSNKSYGTFWIDDYKDTSFPRLLKNLTDISNNGKIKKSIKDTIKSILEENSGEKYDK